MMLSKPYFRLLCLHLLFFLTFLSVAPVVQAQNKNWALLMSKHTRYTRQIWFKKSFFPREGIKKYWKLGYSITSVSYGEGKWVVVLSRGSGHGLQSWATRNAFPREKINDYWRRGYSVTSLAYGNGMWAIVGTKKSGLTRQYWVTDVLLPTKRINEYWRKGYAITNVAYGGGKWAVMMSKSSGLDDQAWVRSSNFPASRIGEKWKQGYSITSMAYGGGKWLLVFSKNTGYTQSWGLRGYFPSARIDTYWKKKYAITGLVHGAGTVVSNNSVISHTKPKPNIRWRSPSGYAISTSKNQYALDVCIRSSSGVSKVSVYVNDRLQMTKDLEIIEANDCAKNIRQKISLTRGLNIVKVSATNTGGTVTSSRRINYTPQVSENNQIKASVNWSSPSSFSSTTSDRNYTLNACIKSSSRVRSVKVYVNGSAQVTRGFEVISAENCTKSLNKTVALQKGVNNISVVVVNAAGPQTFRRTIKYQSLATNTGTKGKRIALVIGNADYQSAPLRNPVNDAKSMARALRNVGFEVMEYTNATQETMETAITQFGYKIKRGGIGLFYFAGHGLQVKGENYLVPLKAKIDKEQQVKYRSVNLGLVLAEMDAASNSMNIVILDACRNNPFKRSFRSATRGLASTMAPTGTFIAYATAPGSVTADGDGDNGLYTQELLKKLRIPGLTIEQVFKKVRAAVLQKTSGRQTPWENSSIIGDFYFRK